MKEFRTAFFLSMLLSFSSWCLASVQKALVIENDPISPIGLLEKTLLDSGFEITLIQVQEQEQEQEIPKDTSDYNLVVLLGGRQSAMDSEENLALAAQIHLIQQRKQAQQATIGICLGAQLIAKAIGGEVFVGKFGPEIGWQRISYGSGLSAMVYSHHHDSFSLPASSEVLAQSEHYPQAFRDGSLIGVQFHPEVEMNTIESWYDLEPMVAKEDRKEQTEADKKQFEQNKWTTSLALHYLIHPPKMESK